MQLCAWTAIRIPRFCCFGGVLRGSQHAERMHMQRKSGCMRLAPKVRRRIVKKQKICWTRCLKAFDASLRCNCCAPAHITVHIWYLHALQE